MELNVWRNIVANGDKNKTLSLLGNLIHYSLQHTWFNQSVSQLCNSVAYDIQSSSIIMRE